MVKAANESQILRTRMRTWRGSNAARSKLAWPRGEGSRDVQTNKEWRQVRDCRDEHLDDAAQPQSGDDSNGVPSPPRLDEPDSDTIGNIWGELLVVAAREVIQEGELV